jgi:CHAD domain-containing protein
MTASRRRDELLRTQLTGFTRLLRRLEKGELRAIHRTRVASRRLRELLPVLQIDADNADRIMRDLRRVTRTLGRVRELDVLAELVGGIKTEAETEMPAGAAVLTATLDDVRTARQRAHQRALRKGLERRVRRIARRLEKVAEGLAPADGRRENQRWLWALDARVARRAVNLREAITHAGGVYLPERLHEVRKATKKLRYGIELAGQAVSQNDVATTRTLRQVQDVLGHLHDQQVVIDRIRELQARLSPDDKRASRQLDTVISTIENECRRLHGRYVRRRDGVLEICDRFSSRQLSGAARSRSHTHLAQTG